MATSKRNRIVKMGIKKKAVKEGLAPLRVDLPQWIHDELALLPGSKKMNGERLLDLWAKKQIKTRKAAEDKLNK